MTLHKHDQMRRFAHVTVEHGGIKMARTPAPGLSSKLPGDYTNVSQHALKHHVHLFATTIAFALRVGRSGKCLELLIKLLE